MCSLLGNAIKILFEEAFPDPNFNQEGEKNKSSIQNIFR